MVKKSKVLLNAAFGIILCIIVIPCLFLLGSKVGQPNTQQAEVYYLVNPSNTLKSIDVDVTETETVEAARTLLEKMKEQPKKRWHGKCCTASSGFFVCKVRKSDGICRRIR